ncbi:MAG: transposase [Omnitrophica bacterium]|nr:transposase [Candidatus Omnitrophota bacterium]
MPKHYTRRNTNRIPQHDYSKPGQYFVTICIQNRTEIFGAIKNNQMKLNDAGQMVNFWWQEMFKKYNNISIDEYTIMPNHVHGIINIVGAGSPRPDNNNNNDKIIGRGNHIVGRGNLAPTIGNIIAYFKYQTTKQINKSQNTPGIKIWQRGYHDHIIRNDKSLNNIRQYIKTNPATWQYDLENPNRIDNIELLQMIV